jgi:hypothetical protein
VAITRGGQRVGPWEFSGRVQAADVSDNEPLEVCRLKNQFSYVSMLQGSVVS